MTAMYRVGDVKVTTVRHQLQQYQPCGRHNDRNAYDFILSCPMACSSDILVNEPTGTTYRQALHICGQTFCTVTNAYYL